MEINVYKQPINERSWVWNRLNSMEICENKEIKPVYRVSLK